MTAQGKARLIELQAASLAKRFGVQARVLPPHEIQAWGSAELSQQASAMANFLRMDVTIYADQAILSPRAKHGVSEVAYEPVQ